MSLTLPITEPTIIRVDLDTAPHIVELLLERGYFFPGAEPPMIALTNVVVLNMVSVGSISYGFATALPPGLDVGINILEAQDLFKLLDVTLTLDEQADLICGLYGNRLCLSPSRPGKLGRIMEVGIMINDVHSCASTPVTDVLITREELIDNNRMLAVVAMFEGDTKPVVISVNPYRCKAYASPVTLALQDDRGVFQYDRFTDKFTIQVSNETASVTGDTVTELCKILDDTHQQVYPEQKYFQFPNSSIVINRIDLEFMVRITNLFTNTNENQKG